MTTRVEIFPFFSFCYSTVMDVFLLSCNYLFSLCEYGIWPKVSLQFCFSLFRFWIFGERKWKWPERLKYKNNYRLMYRQIPFSCNNLQTTVDVMFPTETSLNEIFFQFGGVKKVTVSYAFRDHLLNRLMLDCVSSICEGFFVDGDTRDSRLRAERFWGFSCFRYNFPSSPCLYIWNHTVADGEDASLSLRHFQHCSIHHCCAAQLWSECAVHTDEWSCNSLCRLCFVIFHLLGF